MSSVLLSIKSEKLHYYYKMLERDEREREKERSKVTLFSRVTNLSYFS